MKAVTIFLLSLMMAFSSAAWGEPSKDDIRKNLSNSQQEKLDANKKCEKRCPNMVTQCTRWINRKEYKCEKWERVRGNGSHCCG